MTTSPQVAKDLRVVRGPSALSGSFKRFVSLTWLLARMEFKLRFFGSLLGYFWQLMKPLMLFGVLYIVFTEFVRLGGGVAHYPLVLLAGIVIYTFYSDATSAAVSSVVDRESLVRKIQFPRLVIPFSIVVTTLLTFSLNLGAVVVFILASGVEVRLSWLMLIPLVFVLVAFTSGVAMVLSAYFVRFRDLRPIWDVLLPMTFYATPVLYPIEVIPSKTVQHAIMCNPLAVVIQQVRHSVIDPTAPSAAEAIGGVARLAIPFGLVVLICLIGYWVFDREAPRMAEDL